MQWLSFRNIKLGNQTTFAELANTLFRKLKTEARVCGKTDEILVVYVDNLLKMPSEITEVLLKPCAIQELDLRTQTSSSGKNFSRNQIMK